MNYSLIEDNIGIISFMLFLQVKQTLHTIEALGSFESDYRKIWTRKNNVFGHFSRSEILT